MPSGRLPRFIGPVPSIVSTPLPSRVHVTPSPQVPSAVKSAFAGVLKAAAAEETVDALFSDRLAGIPENEMSISGVCDALGGTANTEKALIAVWDRMRARGFDAGKFSGYAEALEAWSDSAYLLSPWGGILKAEISEQIERIHSFAEPLIPEFAHDPDLDKTVRVADALLESVGMFEKALSENDLDGLRRAAATYETERFKVGQKNKKYEASIRFAQIKNDAKEPLFGREDLNLSEEETSAAMKATAKFARGFGRAIWAYGKAFEEKKRERGRVDYQDLESFACELFVGEDGEPTDIARKIGERFRFIFVDEYQDANGVQDAIFRAIGGSSELFSIKWR